MALKFASGMLERASSDAKNFDARDVADVAGKVIRAATRKTKTTKKKTKGRAPSSKSSSSSQ